MVATQRFFVRPGQPDDARAIAEIHVAAWKKASAGLFPEALLGGPSLERRTQNWHEQLALGSGEDHFVLVAESIDSSGTIGGFCSGGGTSDHDRKGAGELYTLYVDPACWGQGAGGLLLAEALHRFAAAGYAAGELWTLADNQATRDFYEHAGWRADGAGRPFVYDTVEQLVVRYVHDLD